MKKILVFFLVFTAFFSCSSDPNNKLFSLLSSSQTGINFKNTTQETDEFNVLTYGYFYNGGGISVGDLNNDGLADLYFTGNMVGSHLYINKGNFEFEEIAKEAGVFAEGLWNTGTTMADVNSDGLLDIYVCRSAAQSPKKRKNLLFINNGDLTFSEKAKEYGIDDSGYSTQAAFFDYDKDGDLDLFILNHSTQDYAGFSQITARLKNRKNNASSDKLYRNDNGAYVDVSLEAGLITNVLGFGLGVAISDINNDNWPDIYISNDYNEQDYLYINNQDGTFTEGLERYIGHSSLFSMGSDIADINNDGFPEIITLDMLPESNQRIKMVSGPDNYDKYQLLVNSGFYNQTMRNMLQLNNNGESFSEIGQLSGVSNTDWSWASLIADLDNDGYKDIFVTNGYKRDYTNMDFMNFAVQEKLKENRTGEQTAIQDLIKNMPSTIEENYTFQNKGNLTFTKVNKDWGLDQKTLSNGAAYADLDDDGDLDLIVNNMDERAFVYRNNSELLSKNNFLQVSLKGIGNNSFGIGAKVTVQTEHKSLTQELMPTRGFQSSVDYNLLFGLGKETQIKSVTVLWPNNQNQRIQNVDINQKILIDQKEANNSVTTEKRESKTLFTNIDADSIINFHHAENNYIDFKREQLLPHKLSTEGPALTVADVNSDGLEDFYIGGARGQLGKLFLQNKNGAFSGVSIESDDEFEDVDALFFDADNDGDKDLYVVSGGHENEIESVLLQDRLFLNDGKGHFRLSQNALPRISANGSCVKAGDYDQDGDIDLFIGSRSVPGKYPTTPQSFLLENNGKGQFTDVTTKFAKGLQSIGMVTDAQWSDFNKDGTQDLIIVGEFMPIKVLMNVNGEFVDETEHSGLENTEGWYNTIGRGDFDNDGDEDFIVGNFGLNSQLKASLEEPVHLYSKDFDSNGSLDPILTSYNMGESYPIFSKDDLVGQLSALKNRYVNYSDYADQKITDIFSNEELSDATILNAYNFASSYIENLGDGKFQIVPLPLPAQFAPVYAVQIEDFNNDGNLDALLAGNFFGTRVKYGRYDANKGALFYGDGKGNFEFVTNDISGLNINGEVRAINSIKSANDQHLLLIARNNNNLSTYHYHSN